MPGPPSGLVAGAGLAGVPGSSAGACRLPGSANQATLTAAAIREAGAAEGAGGSAMSWGLVLPGARANVAAATWLPDVRAAAFEYWNTLSAALSTTHRCRTSVGSRVMPEVAG